ncbi:MAG: hypothetical protein AAFO28_00835, partial [Pseudomonadota bacterium]
IWGAALAGMSVLMLSRVMIARISMVAGLGALGAGAAYLYAAMAALIGALVALAVGVAIQRMAKRSRSAKRSVGKRSVAENIGRHMGPIDPASELGSESLDAPIDEMPFSSASGDVAAEEVSPEEADSPQDNDIPAELYDTSAADHSPVEVEDVPGPSQNAETQADPEIAPENAALNDDEPDALDLGAFDALDEADPVALEAAVEDVPAHEPAPKRPTTGIEKLRQSSPEDLSLVQLVERFAAALHDIQDRAPGAVAAGTIPSGNTERERALAEALKALALFSDRGFAQVETEASAQPKGLPGRLGAAFGGQADGAAAISETEQQLRDALAKLQNLRGAA